MLQCVAVWRSVSQCVAACCTVLQPNNVPHKITLYGAVCCRVLQCAAVCSSVLQCVAVCCSVLQRVAACCSVLQRVAVCRRVLQCVAVCCSVLQRIPARQRCKATSFTRARWMALGTIRCSTLNFEPSFLPPPYICICIHMYVTYLCVYSMYMYVFYIFGNNSVLNFTLFNFLFNATLHVDVCTCVYICTDVHTH